MLLKEYEATKNVSVSVNRGSTQRIIAEPQRTVYGSRTRTEKFSRQPSGWASVTENENVPKIIVNDTIKFIFLNCNHQFW